jgi:hypothetical protein
MKMARRAILVSFALFLLFDGSTFSEPKDINQQLKGAAALRTAGIVIFSVGVVSFVGLYLLGSLCVAFSPVIAWSRSFEIAGICGLVCIAVGPVLWIGGAHRIQEIKKSEITFQIQGPDLARGRSWGGISLVYRY